jgi:hypothetical protein
MFYRLKKLETDKKGGSPAEKSESDQRKGSPGSSPALPLTTAVISGGSSYH